MSIVKKLLAGATVFAGSVTGAMAAPAAWTPDQTRIDAVTIPVGLSNVFSDLLGYIQVMQGPLFTIAGAVVIMFVLVGLFRRVASSAG